MMFMPNRTKKLSHPNAKQIHLGMEIEDVPF